MQYTNPSATIAFLIHRYTVHYYNGTAHGKQNIQSRIMLLSSALTSSHISSSMLDRLPQPINKLRPQPSSFHLAKFDANFRRVLTSMQDTLVLTKITPTFHSVLFTSMDKICVPENHHCKNVVSRLESLKTFQNKTVLLQQPFQLCITTTTKTMYKISNNEKNQKSL